MAFILKTGYLTRSWLLVAVLSLLQLTSAQFCSFWSRDCIEPLAQTAVPFSFQPLFPDPITLFYGFDALSSGKGQGPMTKTAFWLGYQDRNINQYAIDTNRTTEIALRIGNLTGSPAGGNNGCDGLWSDHCTRVIKKTIQSTIFHLASTTNHYHNPLELALEHLMWNNPSLDPCPPQVFDVASIPVQSFARESLPQQNVTVMTPGSGYTPWQVWYIDDMTSHQQASQVALGIISRTPIYDQDPPHSPDDIQVELICVQAPQAPPSGSSNSDD
ncbi:hypothetical protein PENSTE_c003G03748 [Penicillium steckii]|uniref:Uncharacterized protein n=1 Tax=Penicillium steckii TaxID=303698 RepID=A0A1V6TRB0_9EURO|nr:hypothetical protein PENSTE_c003G03748 [Penicillium steckii]